MAPSKTPDILRAIAQHRAALDRNGRQTASAMLRSYSAAWREIQKDLAAVVAKIDAATAAGTEITPGWLYQEARYRQLLDQVEEQINRFAVDAYNTTIQANRQAVTVAQSHAQQLVKAGTRSLGFEASFTTMPQGAAETIAGMVKPNSPVQQLFVSLGPRARASVSDAFVSGVIRGKNPRAIARDVQRITGEPLSRALTIARTETLRAYRETSRATYLANRDVTSGWVWVSALDRRGCAACWAQHGTEHELTEPFAGHPNCRCAMAPIIDGWTPPLVPGVAEFEKLSDADKRTILGPSKFRAYQDDAIGLKDLAAHTHSPVWGTGLKEESLIGLLGADATRYYKPGS